MNINKDLYKPAKADLWTGRTDSETDTAQFRFHQVVRCVSLAEADDSPGYALLGFASDEGVKRNKGRPGAAKGPDYFRRTIGSLSWHGSGLGFTDFGNLTVKDENLEQAQQELGKTVAFLLKKNKKLYVIGGGHETAFGHYLGMAEFLKEMQPNAKPGILNIDAHFDLRPHSDGAHSGSPFLQAHEHASAHNLDLKYFVYGINRSNNIRSLFETAKQLDAGYCTNTEVWNSPAESLAEVQRFLDSRTHIYLTVCLDVFKNAIAPGVSAPAWNGIELNHALAVLELVKKSGKLLTMDTCELNPEYDEHSKTAKLAGTLFAERML